ncbi:MAG: chemotaxis protein CheD [Psychromonas sp.]|nr:chemotaxis protein CheD [Psychromonas sp.]
MKLVEQLFLNVSELSITNKPMLIGTILGSCVAVIIHVPRLKLSAICHARLPKGPCLLKKKHSFCYVDSALDYMVSELYLLGAKRSELIVKAFGGSQVIFAAQNTMKNMRVNRKKSIGEQNIAALHRGLKKHGLHLVSYDLGGNRGRRLKYNTLNNEVLIKMINKGPVAMDEMGLLLNNFIFNR